VPAIRTIWDCWQNGAKLNFKGEFYRFDHDPYLLLLTPF